MDAVYILGSGSPIDNEEIKYSVRSLAEHMLDLRDIYIIGENPGFLPGAKHIPYPDEYEEKWKNAHAKILKACEIPDISETFLLMNDDFFMRQSFMGAEWPFYALRGVSGGTCGTHNYQVHCPIQIEKRLYQKVPFSLDQKACLSPRTFYANFCHFAPAPCADFVINTIPELGLLDEQAKGLPCVSVSNSTAQDPGFRQWLSLEYPEPSRFE